MDTHDSLEEEDDIEGMMIELLDEMQNVLSDQLTQYTHLLMCTWVDFHTAWSLCRR